MRDFHLQLNVTPMVAEKNPMLVGSREEIEERVEAAGNEPYIMIPKLT